VVRYCLSFKDNQPFLTDLLEKLFSEKAILSQDGAICSRSAYLVLSLCERMQQSSCLLNLASFIIEKSIQVIEACESGQISEQRLSFEDINYFYNSLGLFSVSK
jgi:hypothetical protein